VGAELERVCASSDHIAFTPILSYILTKVVHFPTVKYLAAALGNQPTSQQIVSHHESKCYIFFGRHDERSSLIAFAQCETPALFTCVPVVRYAEQHRER